MENKYCSVIDTEQHIAGMLIEAEQKISLNRDEARQFIMDAQEQATVFQTVVDALHAQANQRLKDAKDQVEIIIAKADEQAANLMVVALKRLKRSLKRHSKLNSRGI